MSTISGTYSIVNQTCDLAAEHTDKKAVVLAKPQDVRSQKWIITEQGTISPLSAPKLYLNDQLEVGKTPYNWNINFSYPGYTIATDDNLLVWVCYDDTLLLERMSSNNYLWDFN